MNRKVIPTFIAAVAAAGTAVLVPGTAYAATYDGQDVEVVRNSDGAAQSCMPDSTIDRSVNGYTCYTPMLNDRNVSSYVFGGRNVDGEVEYTGSY